MSRKYSAWASNQPVGNADLSMMRLTTVGGNEQDQLRNLERVEAIPHMYINVDAPPAPSTTKIDARSMQPVMISRQNSSHFAARSVIPTPTNIPTKIWPMEKPSKNPSAFENVSSSSKRHHKHKNHHHHHHHHSDKHHHHRHHSRRHRAKSAETFRNQQYSDVISSNKAILANPQYIEQDQQQQQQQPMIVYREVSNGEGYTVDPNGLATVPYGADNETSYVDDQQTPMFVYRDGNFQQQQQQQQTIMSDGTSQQFVFNQDQDTIIQQSDQYPSSQIVYCSDPNHQDYHCTSNHNHMIQQSVTPQPQQQFICLDNTQSSTMQPTIINQIPVFNPLSTNTTSQSLVTMPQTPLQRTTSFVIQQPQPQTQQVQFVQQPQSQQLQFVQQPQPLQIVQQPQQLQVIQQPQPLQIIQNPQAQSGQFLQLSPAAPQIIQTIQPQMIQAQPQIIQAQPLLQTIQMPTQAVAASPQILYQRPYDPVLVPVQNQQMTVGNSPLVALSQPSYAPSRIAPATLGIQQQQQQGPAMFRHALLRTVADRTGVPVPTQSVGAVQLTQPTVAAQVAANSNALVAGGMQRSASLPIIPLTPGGILIPFQPSQTPGLRPGPLPRAGGYPTNLRNFNDIRQQMQQRRDQLFQSLQQATYRVPSPPVISATAAAPPPRNPMLPYSTGNPFSTGPRPGGTPFPRLPTGGTYTRLPSSGAYSSPSSPGTYTQLPRPGLNYAQTSSARFPYNPLIS